MRPTREPRVSGAHGCQGNPRGAATRSGGGRPRPQARRASGCRWGSATKAGGTPRAVAGARCRHTRQAVACRALAFSSSARPRAQEMVDGALPVRSVDKRRRGATAPSAPRNGGHPLPSACPGRTPPAVGGVYRWMSAGGAASPVVEGWAGPPWSVAALGCLRGGVRAPGLRSPPERAIGRGGTPPAPRRFHAASAGTALKSCERVSAYGRRGAGAPVPPLLYSGVDDASRCIRYDARVMAAIPCMNCEIDAIPCMSRGGKWPPVEEMRIAAGGSAWPGRARHGGWEWRLLSTSALNEGDSSPYCLSPQEGGSAALGGVHSVRVRHFFFVASPRRHGWWCSTFPFPGAAPQFACSCAWEY